MPTLRDLGEGDLSAITGTMPQLRLVGLGQRYQDLPVATDTWQEFLRQKGLQMLREQMQPQPQNQAPPGGGYTIDELGHRGVRDPTTGYYLLRTL